MYEDIYCTVCITRTPLHSLKRPKHLKQTKECKRFKQPKRLSKLSRISKVRIMYTVQYMSSEAMIFAVMNAIFAKIQD